MAKPTTRAQFKDYCLRKLGHPVIQINLDDDQIDDRIDEALQFFHDYHWDGVEKLYMKHQLTQTDIDRRWIYCPDAVIFVTGVMPFDQSASSVNMFDLRYQLRLHDLYDFTSVSYVSYEMTMQHIRSLQLLFSGTPQFRFNRHQNKVFLDIDWVRDVTPGQYVIIECYRKLVPDTVTLTGTGRTVAAPTNLKVGTLILHVYQDATGSRTITTWNSVFKWPGGVAPTLTTTVGARDVMSFFSDGTNLYGTYINNVS